MKQYSLILLTLTLLSVFAFGANTAKKTPPQKNKVAKPVTPYLSAQRISESTIQLRWGSDIWPKDMMGYNLRRRAIDAKGKPAGEWKSIGGEFKSELLRPRLHLEFLNEHALTRVLKERAKKPEWFNLNVWHYYIERKPENYFKALQASKTDMQFAIAYGFGWYDTTTQYTQSYEYELRRIFKKEKALRKNPKDVWRYDEKPIARCVVKAKTISPPCPMPVRIECKPFGRTHIELQWHFRPQEIERLKKESFSFYLGKSGQPLKKIRTLPVQKVETSKDKKTVYIRMGFRADPKQSHNVGIAVYNTRQKKTGPVGGKFVTPAAKK